jgi:hypothetical protein
MKIIRYSNQEKLGEYLALKINKTMFNKQKSPTPIYLVKPIRRGNNHKEISSLKLILD